MGVTLDIFNSRRCNRLFVLPFYTELRELMDWCVANTTLEIMQWLKVQDIWYEMFLVKCKRVREEVGHILHCKLCTKICLSVYAIVVNTNLFAT